MPDVLVQLPPNTPAIYLVVGLLALVGALFGALGQIGTAALQRRHERRLKLDEARRDTYVEVFLLLKELDRLNVERRRRTESTQEHETQEADARQRREAAFARVWLLASPPVQSALNDAMADVEANRGPTLVEPATRHRFLNTCRAELGVKDDVWPAGPPA